MREKRGGGEEKGRKKRKEREGEIRLRSRVFRIDFFNDIFRHIFISFFAGALERGGAFCEPTVSGSVPVSIMGVND